jgi:molybdate transport system substrate-binding protein
LSRALPAQQLTSARLLTREDEMRQLNAIAALPSRCLMLSLILVAALSCARTVQANGSELRVFSGGAPEHALRAMVSDFERASGDRVQFTFALVTEIQKKLTAGERADLILLPVPLLAVIERSVPLRSEARQALARVGIAVIVPEQAAQPDISTPDMLRTALVRARAVAVPEPTTPSGAHAGRMMTELGIAEAMKPKLVVKAAIHGGTELVAKGEAELGMYLASEVQAAKGIKIIGPLPAPLQNYVVYGSAIPASNDAPQPAADFLNFVADPSRAHIWHRAGFDPLPSGR